MRKQAGILYVKVDGEQFSISGDVEIPLSTEQRETMIDVTGSVVGYKSTYIAPYVSLTSFFVSDFPIQKIIDGTDMTVTAELANGMVYTLSEAILVNETPVTVMDGTVPLRFEGKKGIWG